jgi:hypothetical protein
LLESFLCSMVISVAASVFRCEDMQEIVKWTQVIVHEIFREKTQFDTHQFDGDWWKATFGSVRFCFQFLLQRSRCSYMTAMDVLRFLRLRQL